MQRILHDLSVHQIELEMQNDELRRNEVKLEASRARYFELYSLAPVGYFTIDEKGVILESNLTAAALLGVARSELPGKPLSRFFARQDADEYHLRCEFLSRTGTPQSCELRMVKTDGAEIWVYLTATADRDESGAFIGKIALLDMTERKRAEQESTTNLRILSEFKAALDAHAIVAVTDDRGKITYVNDRFCAISKYAREELIGQDHRVVNSGHHSKPFMQELWQTIKAGRSWSGELKNRAKDGTFYWLATTIFPILAEGKPVQFVAIRTDISERRRAEEALRRSEERFRSLIEWSPDAAAVNRNGKLVYVNPAAVRAFGATSERDLVGRSALDRIHPDSREFVRARSKILDVEGGDAPLAEMKLLRMDGTAVDVESQATRIVYEGEPAALVLFRDISERKQTLFEKNRLEAQLLQAAKMESVGRLAGGVAHDFNNMLVAILGHAELALLRMDRADPVRSDLAAIRLAAQRSADLTRQLLAFARRQVVSPTSLDLNERVTGLLGMLPRMLGEAIGVSWKPEADIWPIRIDPSQVDQIVTNLCVNARDAIADVGLIVIESANVVVDARFCAENVEALPGEYVRLTVRDDGAGMDRDVLAHIFEPFFTTKEMGGGTGLGLATVYGAVRQNHGFVAASSAPGEGTRIDVYLPRQCGPVEARGSEGAESARRSGCETILLVEDEPAVLKLATRVLESQGYTVLAANGPVEALRLAGEHAAKLDLLMTDVIMPAMNGRELAKSVLALAPRVRCLFMSGYTADILTPHGVQEEGMHFLQKPFSVDQLAARVREALDSGG